MKKLEDEKKEKDAVVSKLKAKETELDKQLTSKRKLENNIKNSIAAIIKREIMEAEKAAKAKREAAAKAAAAGANKTNYHHYKNCGYRGCQQTGRHSRSNRRFGWL